jgi:hypothetical protein
MEGFRSRDEEPPVRPPRSEEAPRLEICGTVTLARAFLCSDCSFQLLLVLGGGSQTDVAFG